MLIVWSEIARGYIQTQSCGRDGDSPAIANRTCARSDRPDILGRSPA